MSRPYALIIWLEPLAILLLGIPILLPGRFVEIMLPHRRINHHL